MASIIPTTVHKAQHAVMGSKGDTGDKLADMARDVREHSDKDRLTSDWGVRQSNTDDWLRVTNEEHTGPSLLEDPFAREKVTHYKFGETLPSHALTMT
jgi:catalase